MEETTIPIITVAAPDGAMPTITMPIIPITMPVAIRTVEDLGHRPTIPTPTITARIRVEIPADSDGVRAVIPIQRPTITQIQTVDLGHLVDGVHLAVPIPTTTTAEITAVIPEPVADGVPKTRAVGDSHGKT